MIFLGTGASEAIPNPFCRCEVCRRAMASADPREKRGRSSFSIDEQNLIDFGPDVISAAGRCRVPMTQLRNLFYTHSHSDHMDITNWENLRMVVTEKPYHRVFLSEQMLTGLRTFRDLILTYPTKDYARDFRFYQEHLEFIAVRPYEPFQADDMQVSAVKATHRGIFTDEFGLNYLFERNGRRFLYASDTGPYCEENFEFLKGKLLNTLIIECTFGIASREENHMNCETVKETVDRFRADGVVDDRTEIYLTHIGHKGKLNHVELQQKMRQMVGPQIDVAYDGLRIADF